MYDDIMLVINNIASIIKWLALLPNVIWIYSSCNINISSQAELHD